MSAPRLVLALGALVLVAACGDEVSVGASPDHGGPSRPTEMLAAHGEVTTQYPVTVVERPDADPQICVGISPASFPRACGGLPLLGWDWAEHAGHYRTVGGASVRGRSMEPLRFGEFVVRGTFDGRELTVTWAVPERKFTRPNEPAFDKHESGTLEHTEAELRQVERRLRDVPGFLHGSAHTNGVDLEVLYDDRTIQEWADATFGPDLVRVSSVLVDVEEVP